MKKVSTKYGIVLSESGLENNAEQNIVKIPLRMFLLI